MFLSFWIIILTLAVIWLNIAFIIILNYNSKNMEGRILKLLIDQNAVVLDGSWEKGFSPEVMKIAKSK